jgi:HlyD family secretion protein
LKKRLIIIFFLAILIAIGALVYLRQHQAQIAELYYSGTIEAKQAELAFQVNGKVVDLLVNEGQKVNKNQILTKLDQSEFLARRTQAQANLNSSIKALQQKEDILDLYKTTLPDEVARAEAAVTALEAQLNDLKAGSRAQEIERARLACQAAKITMEQARKDNERFERLYQEGTVSEKERDAVALRYETTFKEYEGSKETFGLLKEGYRKETIRAAEAKLAEGQAFLKQAKNNLKKITAAKSEVEVAAAQKKAARATLEVSEIQLGYTVLKAPFDGIITSRNIEPGEVVSPGREVLSIADMSTVDLKVFVGETEIGKIKPGQKVDVKTDTFPGKIYTGIVSFISPEGEFTPKIIQTHKERVKLVYLVKISIPNPDLELKSGMPADAWFR